MPASSPWSDLRASVARLHGLRPAERRALVALGALVPLVELSLRHVGFVRTRALLARATPQSSPRAQTSLDDAHRLAELAEIVGRRGVLRARCLPQALTVWWWLRREGADAWLRIGTMGTSSTFSAHAWVELEGVALAQRDATHRAFEGL